MAEIASEGIVGLSLNSGAACVRLVDGRALCWGEREGLGLEWAVPDTRPVRLAGTEIGQLSSYANQTCFTSPANPQLRCWAYERNKARKTGRHGTQTPARAPLPYDLEPPIHHDLRV